MCQELKMQWHVVQNIRKQKYNNSKDTHCFIYFDDIFADITEITLLCCNIIVIYMNISRHLCDEVQDGQAR